MDITTTVQAGTLYIDPQRHAITTVYTGPGQDFDIGAHWIYPGRYHSPGRWTRDGIHFHFTPGPPITYQPAVGDWFTLDAACGVIEIEVQTSEFVTIRWAGPCDVTVDGRVDVLDLLDYMEAWFTDAGDSVDLLEWLGVWLDAGGA